VGEPAFTIEVVRSRKRRKTVGARLVGPVLRVSVPAWMSPDEERRCVEEMSRRYERRLDTARVDLVTRAARLARRHGLPQPRSIRWVDDMATRWGSCTAATGSIRVSSRVGAYPDWVLDYVVVHELAHLVEQGHTAAFWALVARCPHAERAQGYLIAKSEDGAVDPLDCRSSDGVEAR
jgi:predicted metal-dependent hydrolase